MTDEYKIIPGHSRHEGDRELSEEAVPQTELYVPSGQLVMSVEASGQKYPGSQDVHWLASYKSVAAE